MSGELVFGYAIRAQRGPSSGLRVRTDGTVELLAPGSDWQAIATLDPGERERLAELTVAAGILGLPSESPAPEDLIGGSDCELWSDLGVGPQHAVIHAWDDANPVAVPSRRLVLALSALVSAAQARGGAT